MDLLQKRPLWAVLGSGQSMAEAEHLGVANLLLHLAVRVLQCPGSVVAGFSRSGKGHFQNMRRRLREGQ